MGPSKAQYRAMLEQALPPEVQQALLLAVGSGYHSAFEHCKRHFEREDRHDALGAARRGKLHGEIRGVAERFSLAAKDEPNSNGSTYFLSVLSGEFRLICCLVAAPNVMVRPAKIRKLWARYNFEPQLRLAFMPSSERPNGYPHLAVLIHSPRGKFRDEPSFTDIVIPNPNFTNYIDRIQLFSRFSKVIDDNPRLFRRRRHRADGALGA